MTTLEKFWEDLKERKYRLRKAIVKPIYLISNENKSVKKGEIYKIKVKSINIPKNTSVYLSPYHISEVGAVFSIGEEIPKPIDIDRSIEHILFMASGNGMIKKGETLGHLLIIPLAIEK